MYFNWLAVEEQSGRGRRARGRLQSETGVLIGNFTLTGGEFVIARLPPGPSLGWNKRRCSPDSFFRRRSMRLSRDAAAHRGAARAIVELDRDQVLPK
jgi:hypothetical protein